MKLLKNSFFIIIVFIAVVLSGSFAEIETESFEDVPVDSWYYEGVMKMVADGIITGYPDGKFLPQKEVSREEFAVMMVRALQLGKNGSDSSFEDVENGYWAVPYIEAAKTYLTGYKTDTGLAFKPKYDTKREDMAVALVKALNYSVDYEQLDLLDDFVDQDKISDNLKAYVATAYAHNLIKGSQGDGGLYFNPEQTLTRAEAAVLLLAVIEDEKLGPDEEKIVLDDEVYMPTRLSVSVADNIAYLKWDKIENKDFQGYKVVVAQYDSTPNYPDNGYMKYITDEETTRYQIGLGHGVTDSDFIGVEAGERYYVTITTLYNEGKKTSNVVSFVLEEPSDEIEYIRPSLRIDQSGSLGKLFWTQVDHPKFKYYKVVVSSNVSSPKYPDEGYMHVISDAQTNSVTIQVGDKGNQSDFDQVEGGKIYYVAISAVYTDQILTSNIVEMKLEELGQEEEEIEVKH
jgi:hypothetical protein